MRLDLLDESDNQKIYGQTGYDTGGGLAILKYQDTKTVKVAEGKFFFANILLEAVKNKQLTVYADSLCVQLADPNLLLERTDTIQEINTYVRDTKEVFGPIYFENIKFFRAYQITYYSSKNNTWASKTLAIAPLETVTNQLSKFVTYKPMFWVKVANKKVDLNASSTTWAVRRWSKGNENTIDVNTIKVLKKGNDVPMLHFLNALKTNPQLRVYKANNWYEKELLSATDKENIFVSIDTIQTIDPVTYESKMKVVRTEFDEKIINKLRLVQEWAWDDKRKVLSVRCLGVAPLRPIKNEVGEFLFDLPMFYQRFDD